jgi:hypothetical protein
MVMTGLVSKHSREDLGLLLGGKVRATMERRGETGRDGEKVVYRRQ